ncbi:MAG: glycoside hydrolase family 88 protein [Clostridia bacterium]|nr:glycoside hydrolase family 88 protein [Clostridia bacterium]
MYTDSTAARVKRAALAMQRHNWEQGVLAQAFLEAGDEDIAILLALEAANRQQEDGRCAQIGGSTASTDPCAVGEALIAACERTHDPFLIAARDRLLRWAVELAPRNGDGIVYHFSDGCEFWVDSMYMLPPFLARAGHPDEAVHQLDGYWAALYRPEKGLLAHRWDDQAKRFVREDAWGVGNGWAASGMARVIDMLPQGDAGRERLIRRVKELLTAALPLMREDGLFHDVLDDPRSFTEINCGQMLAYTIYRGVRSGWLEETLLPQAERIYEAALSCVDTYGLVRPVCGMPTFDRPGIAAEGQAFFILMHAQREKLRKK